MKQAPCNPVPNHYEELGVSPSATHKELQTALRRLVRMLHPDLHSDEHSRQLAESQIKRLNAIRSILLNPAKRREYNRALFSPHTPRVPQPILPIPHIADAARDVRWPWWVAGALLAFCLMVYLWSPSVHTVPNQAPKVSRTIPALVRKPERSAQRGKHFHAPPPNLHVPHFEAVPMLDPAPAHVMDSQWAKPAVDLPPAPEDPPARLSGRWLYAGKPGRTREQSFAPEYVQVKIQEDGDLISGAYEGKYAIGDRLISPIVKFRFSGKKSSLDRMTWSGPDGSSGYLSLVPTDAQRLELKWTAETLGSDLAFVSGAANLTRLSVE